MDFSINRSVEILRNTPLTLENMLSGLNADWTTVNEGTGTWSAYDILGHLVQGEKTDWIARLEIILSENTDKNFKPFDRFAQFNESKNKTLKHLTNEFKMLRKKNLEILQSKKINEIMLAGTGIHPAFGEVTLKQLLSTWVVHDLNHIAQIARVMAKQYKTNTGPWIEYLPILQDKNQK